MHAHYTERIKNVCEHSGGPCERASVHFSVVYCISMDLVNELLPISA